jgi:hypothetical protein
MKIQKRHLQEVYQHGLHLARVLEGKECLSSNDIFCCPRGRISCYYNAKNKPDPCPLMILHVHRSCGDDCARWIRHHRDDHNGEKLATDIGFRVHDDCPQCKELIANLCQLNDRALKALTRLLIADVSVEVYYGTVTSSFYVGAHRYLIEDFRLAFPFSKKAPDPVVHSTRKRKVVL